MGSGELKLAGSKLDGIIHFQRNRDETVTGADAEEGKPAEVVENVGAGDGI